MIQNNVCCFFGHREIEENETLVNSLNKVIERLIVEEKVGTFLFGSKSQFNKLCYIVVSGLKEKYPYIRRIYVRAEFPYIDEDYKDYLLEMYEDTYYPEKIIKAGKAAYIERNYEMIDNSNFCVAYYNEDYVPTGKINSQRNLSRKPLKSGTRIAFEYAKKKKVNVINMFTC